MRLYVYSDISTNSLILKPSRFRSPNCFSGDTIIQRTTRNIERYSSTGIRVFIFQYGREASCNYRGFLLARYYVQASLHWKRSGVVVQCEIYLHSCGVAPLLVIFALLSPSMKKLCESRARKISLDFYNVPGSKSVGL
jgi:hypothetical protein